MTSNRATAQIAEPKELPADWSAGMMLSDIVHRIGHDIGNPLTAVISLASIIDFSSHPGSPKPLAKEKLQEYSRSMTSEAWKVSHVVERFVMMFSSRRGNPIPCSMGDIAEKCVQRLRSRNGLADLSIESDFFFAPHAPRVLADTDQLFLLTSEILLNAYHYQGSLQNSGAPQDAVAGRTVHCSLEAAEGGVQLRFSNPLPVPYVGDLADLFRPLVTGTPEEPMTDAAAAMNKPMVAKNLRTGIGLPAVWSIIHRHRGKIQIEQAPATSETPGSAGPSGGWRFTVHVFLPAADDTGGEG